MIVYHARTLWTILVAAGGVWCAVSMLRWMPVMMSPWIGAIQTMAPFLAPRHFMESLAYPLVREIAPIALLGVVAVAAAREAWLRMRLASYLRASSRIAQAHEREHAVAAGLLDQGIGRACRPQWMWLAVGLLLIAWPTSKFLFFEAAELARAEAERRGESPIIPEDIATTVQPLGGIPPWIYPLLWGSVGVVSSVLYFVKRRSPTLDALFLVSIDVVGHSAARIKHGAEVTDRELDLLYELADVLARGAGGYRAFWGGDGGLVILPTNRLFGDTTHHDALSFAAALSLMTEARAQGVFPDYAPSLRILVGRDAFRRLRHPETWHSDEINSIMKKHPPSGIWIAPSARPAPDGALGAVNLVTPKDSGWPSGLLLDWREKEGMWRLVGARANMDEARVDTTWRWN